MMFFSAEKAMRELDFVPRPVREALCDAVNWFRENGYLHSRSSMRPETVPRGTAGHVPETWIVEHSSLPGRGKEKTGQ